MLFQQKCGLLFSEVKEIILYRSTNAEHVHFLKCFSSHAVIEL